MAQPDERVVEQPLQIVCKEEQPTLTPSYNSNSNTQIKREPGSGTNKFQLASELAV